MFLFGKRPARESVNAHLSPPPLSGLHHEALSGPCHPDEQPARSPHITARLPAQFQPCPSDPGRPTTDSRITPHPLAYTQSPAAPPPPSPPLPGRRTLLWVADTLSGMRYLVDSGAETWTRDWTRDVDEELEKNLHSWTQLDVQDNVPLSPDMFPMEHRQIWVDLFIRYNTPVPSSAAVERLFSMGSDVMRPKRSSLTAKNFEKLVFLKGNMNLLKGRWELEDSDEED
ncbi:hypothetical protein GWK47_023256 [Chionoecetes opilio]|uniref:HAT C-terminal dimerisation domain-containing protein n=1 Tax=Chionoecetes opilio TaxID=41210 RepID=A0A8J4XMM6_CHIOP|nr:hypothetical protein GWK47_023256 [Chionoecetes opilio]